MQQQASRQHSSHSVEMNGNGPFSGSVNLAFIEGLYADYLRDPGLVSPEWQKYFRELGNREGAIARPRLGPSFRPASLFNPPGGPRYDTAPVTAAGRIAELQDRVNQLIRNYRVRGHMIARIDPLGLPRPIPPELDPGFLGFTEVDMDSSISSETFQYDGGPLTVRQILQRLQNTYCQSIGVQYMHIDDLAVRRWLQKRMEGTENRLQLGREEQLRILTRLSDAVTFEEFIRKKFIGAKSFSLEGSESLIPLLDLAIEKAGAQGIQEIVMGMAHRGRLNVLANILGKSPREIFREFADADPELYVGRGDVKYHLGYSSDWKTSSGQNNELGVFELGIFELSVLDLVMLRDSKAASDAYSHAARSNTTLLCQDGRECFAMSALYSCFLL